MLKRVFMFTVVAMVAVSCGTTSTTTTGSVTATTDAAFDTEGPTATTTTTTAATTTTTVPDEPDGLPDGEHRIRGSYAVTYVFDPPQEMADWPVLKPYEGAPGVLEDQQISGNVTCSEGHCSIVFEFLQFQGWRAIDGTYGGSYWDDNPTDPDSHFEGLLFGSPAPFSLTDDGYVVSLATRATCGDEETDVQLDLLFDTDLLLGQQDPMSVSLATSVAGGMNAAVDHWGRDEGEGWATCWLPSIALEPLDPSVDM